VKRNSATGGDIDRASDSGEAVLHALSLCPRLAQLESIWTPKDRIDIIRSVAPWWKKIGLLLKISEATLDVIDTNYKDLLSQCRNMFQRWLEGASVKPVSWATLLEALQDCGLYAVAQNVTDVLSTIFQFPDIHGANILTEVVVKISPGEPLTYQWKGTGFKIHIPAGAIESECDPVTMSIQASLSGKYHLPADGVLVSGIYWVALHPTLKKRFDKKVTVYIKHCASVADSALSFITAKCTEEPPYTFKSLPAKIFSESKEGTIEVDHFSSLAIKGRKHSISDYAFCTFYIQKQLNIYEAHITVTPNSRLQLKGVTKKYEGKEEGPRRNACVTETEVSLNIHKNTWEKDGWEVTLLLPPTLKKKDLDGYKRGKIIPHFSMRLKLQHSLNAQSLVQEIGFAGVEPQTFFIAILRDPLPEQASETKGKTHSQPANLCINDLAAVKTELLSVTARWRQIGEVLELAPPKLEVIAAENSDLEICLSKVLSQWLNKAYNTERLGEPSWKLLARVVANPAGGDNPALAQQITGRYGGAEHS
jgi:hypothetical protein